MNQDDRFATKWTNLASENLNTKVLYANDEFFAQKENLIRDEVPIFKPDKFIDSGKWMDGWETKRRRDPGHDHCILRLGVAGQILGLDIDTRHFRGNQPEQASVEACCLDHDPDQNTQWQPILSPKDLKPNSQHLFLVQSKERWTHLRLNIFPDGGVARFKVYGEAAVDWENKVGQNLDLAAIVLGSKVIGCSDMHFGHKDNLIMPNKAKNMGEGWETRRRRGDGYDWAVIQLAQAGSIKNVELDTAYFKGNYPASCSLQALHSPNAVPTEANELEKWLASESLLNLNWQNLLSQTPLEAHRVHAYQINSADVISHVKLNIYPDGGVSRLRIYGKINR